MSVVPSTTIVKYMARFRGRGQFDHVNMYLILVLINLLYFHIYSYVRKTKYIVLMFPT